MNEEKELERPIIFNYFDHKLFCQDFFDYKKKTDRRWSFEFFARKTGLHKTYLSGIINQESKKIGLDQVEKVAKGFELNKKETEFFEVLVRYNRSKTEEESQRRLQEIFDIKAQKNPLFQLEREKFNFFAKWYYVALYEMVKTRKLKYLKTPPKVIAENLKGNIKEKDVVEAFRELEDLGMLKKDPGNVWVQTKGSITTPDDNIFHAAKYHYHKEMIELTKEALDQHRPNDIRELTGLTFAVPESKLPEIVKKMRKLRDEINKASESFENNDRVYQLNLHLFPLTKE